MFLIRNTNHYLYNKENKSHASNGAVALSTTLIIGTIVFEVAAAALLASYLISQEGAGVRIASAVNFAARSGANDAIRRISINGFSSSASYEMTLNNVSISVVVCKELTYVDGECVTPVVSNKYEVISSASSLNKRSRYRSIVAVDPNTYLATVESFSEVAAN